MTAPRPTTEAAYHDGLTESVSLGTWSLPDLGNMFRDDPMPTDADVVGDYTTGRVVGTWEPVPGDTATTPARVPVTGDTADQDEVA